MSPEQQCPPNLYLTQEQCAELRARDAVAHQGPVHVDGSWLLLAMVLGFLAWQLRPDEWT